MTVNESSRRNLGLNPKEKKKLSVETGTLKTVYEMGITFTIIVLRKCLIGRN